MRDESNQDELYEIIQHSQKLGNLYDTVQEIVSQILASKLELFNAAINDIDAATLEAMFLEIIAARKKSGTIDDLVARLTDLVPTLPQPRAPHTYQDAISNLEIYGAIEPSKLDITQYHKRFHRDRSLARLRDAAVEVGVALLRLIKIFLEEFFDKSRFRRFP